MNVVVVVVAQAKDIRKAQPTAAQKTKEEGDG